jgi:hypothetical protein
MYTKVREALALWYLDYVCDFGWVTELVVRLLGVVNAHLRYHPLAASVWHPVMRAPGRQPYVRSACLRERVLLLGACTATTVARTCYRRWQIRRVWVFADTGEV